MPKLKLLLIIFCLGLFSNTWSQAIQLEYIYMPKEKPQELKKLFKETSFKDSLSVVDYLKEQRQILFSYAYLSASVDSIIKDQGKWKAYIFIGHPVETLQVDYANKFQGLLKKANSKYLSSATLSALELESENLKIIEYLDNQGYPKARVYLDSIRVTENSIKAFLMIERGDRITFGTVKTEGNVKISKSFLQGYTGIKSGEPYALDKLKNTKKLINDLSFAKQKADLILKQNEQEMDVSIPMQKASGNRFDGILGILPNDKTTGKTVLTGEVNIALQNILRSGEQFKFEWKKLESTSQNLDVNFKIPYIFNTSFGISSDLSLVKQDSTFLNANLSIGGLYFLQADNYLGLRYVNKSSSTLLDETLLNTSYQDFTINNYGVTFKYTKLDYNFNPRKGFDIALEGYLGRKSTRGEDAKNTSQSELSSEIHWYIPLMKKSTVRVLFRAANLNSEAIYTNELFRIGGLSSIRGFMESSIYASSYGILSLEYRFVFEQNSALFAFADGAWIEKRQEDYFYDYPLGVGLGLFFKTKAGIFTISYAMGQQKNEEMAIKNAKIHFGFINRF